MTVNLKTNIPTLAYLRELAQQHNIPGYGRMRKADLLKELEARLIPYRLNAGF